MEHGATSSILRRAKVRSWSAEQITSFSPEMFCPEEPPPAPEGEGSEKVFGMEVTKYRCKNGFEWSNGKWPYLEMECLNKKWAPKTLPECVREYQSNLIIAPRRPEGYSLKMCLGASIHRCIDTLVP